MGKIVIILLLVLICSTATAAYTWEYWTTGRFGAKDFFSDEAIEITGGGGGQVMLFSNSIALIEDTDPTGIHEIVIHNDSLLYINGGTIDMISSFQRPRQSYPDLPPVGPEHIFITCHNYNYDDLTGILSGTWTNWDTFNIQLVSETAFEAIDNISFTIAPEPATLALFGLGGLLLRRRRA